MSLNANLMKIAMELYVATTDVGVHVWKDHQSTLSAYARGFYVGESYQQMTKNHQMIMMENFVQTVKRMGALAGGSVTVIFVGVWM